MMSVINSSERPHDPDLPAWGPYGKLYAGASHIPDADAGLLWNYSFMPTLFRRRAETAALRWEAGHHPWEAAPDFSYWKYRYELIWKDELFCDVEYCAAEAGGVLVRAEFVNSSRAVQNAALHHLAFLARPGRKPKVDTPVVACALACSGGARWLSALGYRQLSFAHARERDGLELAGSIKGEVAADGFVSGFGLAEFAEFGGSDAIYEGCEVCADLRLLVRARVPVGGLVQLGFEGCLRGHTTIVGTGEIQLVEAKLSGGDGSRSLQVRCLQGCADATVDGFVLLPPQGEVHFSPVDWDAEPCASAAGGRGLILRYSQVEVAYGLVWPGDEPFCRRELITDNLDHLLKVTAHDHVRSRIESGPGQYHSDIFIRPIVVRPGERRVLRAALNSGSPAALDVWARDSQQQSLSEFDHRCAEVRSRAFRPASLPAGGRYVESQLRMAATTLTNVVYPTRIKGCWNRHFTPGKWWDSPYTWDSGMIAVGLIAIDPRRALECVRAYLTEPGDDDAAFVHWGSPVPTQFYAFQEAWNCLGAPLDLARHFFPGLRQFHRFLVGRHRHSRTRMPSGLIRTFDYFYNSGGWDDYPAQVFVHEKDLASRVAPTGNTAHSIRCAKILRQLAVVLGEDPDEFDQDVADLTRALQEHAWDDEAGIFSYVLHDEVGRALGPLRDPDSGSNFNLGMDGLLPLISGICGDGQRQRLLDRLLSPEHLRTPIGLTAVDQSAPYYRADGYWNGAVWMPHQWLFWKALLDFGMGDAAWQIASTALDLWSAEVSESYNCFEHFLVESGRGAGWHCFSGLSCPVLAWFAAYFRPGRVQSGFDATIRSLHYDSGVLGSTMTARLLFFSKARSGTRTIIATGDWKNPHVLMNNRPAGFLERHSGCVEVEVPFNVVDVELLVTESRSSCSVSDSGLRG